MPLDPSVLTRRIVEAARGEGFTLAGVCPTAAPAGYGRFLEWVAAGYPGEMHYLAERADAYADPGRVLEGVRSLVVLALPYETVAPRLAEAGQGRVARYAWGEIDYHDLIHPRLKRLAALCAEIAPGSRARGVVDTAPLLEREFAQRAGLGWIGKNTLLLNREAGSYFFLAALLTDLELEYDEPFATDHCGTCRACLDACPTDAFPEPYVLNASRCISYLTIEHRGPIAPDLRADMGDWVFGCDICQEVCPWNRKPEPAGEPNFQPRELLYPLDLLSLFDLDDGGFRVLFRATPLWRAKRRGLLRNAAIALGNGRDEGSVAALGKGLNDCEPLVRGASAWALGQFKSASAEEMLRERQKVETDADVLAEIEAALTH